jgi:pilus assembly protein CpaB
MKQVTSGELPDGVYHSKAELIGRGVVIPMVRNEMVLANKVAVEGVGAGLSSRIPQGMRAVSLRVNDVVSVAGFVKPGTRVDVLLTGTPKGGGDVMVTTTVLENVEVLTTGQEMSDNGKPKPDTTVVTLLVSPEDAQKLTLASQGGRIQLALRNPLDLNPGVTVSTRETALYHLPTPAAPAPRTFVAAKRPVPPPAPSVYVVELIRGDKRDVSKF